MPLRDPDYNAFAHALSRRFRDRILGLDTGSARIINVRPSDHILAGFLTPVSHQDVIADPDALASAFEEALADDLPKDSSYEQTSIGLEWLAPTESLASTSITVNIGLTVYVRRIPSLEEQRSRVVWKDQRTAQERRSGAPATRAADLVAVWTRETLTPIQKILTVEELLHSRRLTVGLSTEIADRTQAIQTSNLYPGRRPIQITEADLSSPENYAHIVSSNSRASLPVQWNAELDVRLIETPTEHGVAGVALRLINRTDPVSAVSSDYADSNLYAISLQVSLPRGSYRPTIFRELPASFRYDRRMAATGINSYVTIETSDETTTLHVDPVPTAVVPRLEPRVVENAQPTFAGLAQNPIPILRSLHSAMAEYDRTVWNSKVNSLDGVERDEAIEARNNYRVEMEQFARGIDLLENQAFADVRRAFELMNSSMSVSAAPHREWRLFQIVFIVSQIPILAGREYPELRSDGDDFVDVLWFAAGGGKTEAFLGLIVWQSFFDRMRDKDIGVTAFVRFPLRLLTFQQLQRLARALAAAETIRDQEGLGGARFSMGYFVGQGVTPNRINDELHSRYQTQGVDERLKRVFQCPFCRSSVTLAYDASLRLVEHRCSRTDCPGGPQRLPIYVVDEDLYRFLPTVIVSTVDKLAQIGQNQRFANFFGRFDMVCHRHGATFRGTNRDLCPAANELASGRSPHDCGGSPVSYGPFHDPAPALLVQDELHLLSEELGTFDSHYETAAMAMMRSLGHMPWKIVAATATIENYQHQSWQLYLQSARQFPGPGPDAYDSFYYTQDSTRIGRIFIGVLGVGRKHTPVVTRTLSLLYLELQYARELSSRDPAAAATTYGTGALTSQDFRDLIFLYELPLTYVLTRKGSDQVAEAIESRVKKELRDLAPEHGELLIDMFNGGVDISDMIATMERIRAADSTSSPEERVRGLVTTNIIGHGVDVDRFNIIVFAGFTRLVAEYIQASARVGRTYPGLSIFVATPQSERDRSIFDRFAKFHEYLDRLVDPTAINRWPEPALMRTIPGILCGYLMAVAAQQVGHSLWSVEAVQQQYSRSTAAALTETNIVDWMLLAYGSAHAPSERYRERISTTVRNHFSLIVNTPPRQRQRPLNTFLQAMRSLRDVDDPAFIKVIDPADESILRRFING